MIQIRVVCDIHYSKGETPVLEFDDVREAEKFVAYLQEQIQFARGSKRKRLEFFHDGIYLDGRRLEIKGLAERFLREFETSDEVSESTLAYNVWADSTKSREAIYNTCSRVRKATGIWIERDGAIYRILRPT